MPSGMVGPSNDIIIIIIIIVHVGPKGYQHRGSLIAGGCTKHISEQGQLQYLREYRGLEVLILPPSETYVRPRAAPKHEASLTLLLGPDFHHYLPDSPFQLVWCRVALFENLASNPHRYVLTKNFEIEYRNIGLLSPSHPR